MSTEWSELGWGPWPVDSRVPGTPPDEETRAREQFPRTLLPVPGEGVVQRPTFDPALAHYAKAMRAGDPAFAEDGLGARWYAARAVAFDHALAAVTESRWAEHLVLRGSVLLAAWFGPAARPPGDLDFVVIPRSWDLEDERTERMFGDLARRAEERSWRGDSGVRLSAADAVSDEIWTYDRVPGRRLVLPWEADGLPRGAVQIDFVFGERLPSAPAPTAVPRPGGAEPLMPLAATPEQSLAWKLLWLISDMHPQAKDLYDAMLLAEVASPDARLLRETFVAADTAYASRPPTLDDLSTAVRQIGEEEWDEFRKEHPDRPTVPGSEAERLIARLAPIFTEPTDPPGPEYERRAAWLAPHVDGYRPVLAARGLGGLQSALAADEIRFIDAAVIVNEILGRPAGEVERTVREMLAGPDWPRGQADYYLRQPQVLKAELARLRR